MTKFDSSSAKEGSVDPPAAAAAHVFLQTLNPMRGKMEWKPKPVDYDYKQEVARAAFADMLHDTERVNIIATSCNFCPDCSKQKL